MTLRLVVCEDVEFNWRDLNGLLGQTVEQFASRGGGSPIKAEREFVEIVFEVFVSDAPLMRAHQPTLEQRNDPMHSRQQMLGVGRLLLLDLAVMDITFQFTVSLQAIRYDRAAGFNGLLNESMQRCPVGVGNMPQPDAADAFAIGFGGHDNQCLGDGLATSRPDSSPPQ